MAVSNRITACYYYYYDHVRSFYERLNNVYNSFRGDLNDSFLAYIEFVRKNRLQNDTYAVVVCSESQYIF